MKILVLAGGNDQIALIKELKKRDCEVILVDYLEFPPAADYADKHYRVSTLDEESVIDVAHQEKVDRIMTACSDQALMTAAKVSELLGLPFYLSEQTARFTTNKKYMKQIMLENGISTSKYQKIENLETLSIMSYPMVVKPVDCNSSKGVVSVNTKEELLEAYENAKGQSRSREVIVEEFIDGKEISVDAFVKNGQAKILCLRELKKIRNRNTFTIVQGVIPAEMNEVVIQKIADEIQKIANVFKLTYTMLLVQLIVTKDDEIFIVEFSPRLGGGSKYKTIEIMTGVDVMKTYVDMAFGHEVDIVPIKKNIFGHMNFCYANPGFFEYVEGLDMLKNEGIIQESFLYKASGSMIENVLTSTDRVMGFLVIGESEEEVQRKEKIAMQRIRIIDQDGNDMFARQYVGWDNG